MAGRKSMLDEIESKGRQIQLPILAQIAPAKTHIDQQVTKGKEKAFNDGRAGEAAWWWKNHTNPDYKDLMERRYQKLQQQLKEGSDGTLSNT